MEQAIRFGWDTTSAKVGGRAFMIVHEARSFADRAEGVPLNSGSVSEFLPRANRFINWQEKAFFFPCEIEASGCVIRFAPAPWLEDRSIGGARIAYLAHALIAAGFLGNVLYKNNALTWFNRMLDHSELGLPYDISFPHDIKKLIVAYAHASKNEDPREAWYYLMRSKIFGEYVYPLDLPEAQHAAADALRRHFGGDVPVLCDRRAPSRLDYDRSRIFFEELEIVGHVKPEEVVRCVADRDRKNGNSVIFADLTWRQKEWEPAWRVLGPKTSGILGSDSAVLTKRGYGEGWTLV